MVNQNSSMQSQSPLADAQDSVNTARRAVDEALSHPSSTSMEQADNALAKAWRSVRAAEGNDNRLAVEDAKEQLNGAQMDLDKTKQQFS